LPEHVEGIEGHLAVRLGSNDLAKPDDSQNEAIVENDSPIDTWHGAEELPENGNLLLPESVECLKELVEIMESEEPWDDRIENYLWKGRTFYQTQSDLGELIWKGTVFARLIEAGIRLSNQDELELIKWAEAIFDWGGTRQQLPVTVEKIKSTLTNAVSNKLVVKNAPINSGYTKIASFATTYLENTNGRFQQVIFDSRVAASLTSRLDEILIKRGQDNPSNLFPGLGTVDAARGGTRPRQLKLNWPNAYRSWYGQFAATRIVYEIQSILNNDDRYTPMPNAEGVGVPWTIRGVEAVLFMDGY
jgi:hypothetical protein